MSQWFSKKYLPLPLYDNSMEANHVSIIRKRVIANVPGFSDPNELNDKSNEWLKLYDFDCVNWSFGNTVQAYDLEFDANYNNTANKQAANFYIETPFQSVAPPYDIHTGDYLVYYQGDTLFMWRIVKINQFQLFSKCAVFELAVNMTQPKEADINLEVGALESVEIVDGKVVKKDGHSI